MNKQLIAYSFACVAMAAVSAPVVSSVSATQEPDFGLVTVGYTLSEDAVVTFDVQTNGVSIGLDKVRRVWGDVNCRVTAGRCTFTWNPRPEWNDAIDLSACQFAVKAWSLAHPPDYMAINLEAPSNICFYAGVDALPCALSVATLKSKWMLMRRIPAAGVRWRMGSPTNEDWRRANEIPHYVTLDHDYYMGVFKVTGGQFRHFCTAPAGNDEGPAALPCSPVRNLGVEFVRGATADYDWPNDGHAVDPAKFIGKLRAHCGIGDLDLPTEAEWEYACRAGTPSARYNGKGVAYLPEIAWYNHKDSVQEVGLLQPNAWGLYDMIGNLFELCLDWYSDGDAFCKSGEEVAEPKGPASGTKRVFRGCSYSHGNDYARSASRDSQPPASPYITLGMRLRCRTDFLVPSTQEN